MESVHYAAIFKMESSHWWYRVRQQIALDALKTLFPLTDRKLSILDAGCGAGGLLKTLRPYGTIHGIDFAPQAVEFCKSQGLENVKAGDITAIAYPDHSFDVVFALDVIEHVQEDEQALREIHRVLKPGGYAIIAVPAFRALWGVTDELSHHFRRYGRGELVEKMKHAGFKIRRSTYFNTFLFLPIALVRIGVRWAGIKMKSENFQPTFMNRLLYGIFSFESKLLRMMDFPVGISFLAVGQKN